VDNSIRLKELQVVTGVLKKRDERLGIVFYFKRVFLGQGRMW